MLDYLIVGFGLGGLHLSNLLENREKTFIVLNDNSQKASKVSGGLCNPVALNNFSLIWKGSQNMLLANEAYQFLEQKTGSKFQFEMPIYRMFSSQKEQDKWLLTTEDEHLKHYLNPILIPDHAPIQSSHKFGETKHSYVIKVAELLQSYSAYLFERKKYQPIRFNYSDLKIASDYVEYENIRAKKIVFCEGFGLKNNPFFNYLPLVGNKGEYIIIHSPKAKLKAAVKSSFFLIPLGDDLYKFGATYNRDFTHQEPTKSAKLKLETALNQLLDCPYSIVDQVAGVRPTTPDKKPLLGKHPEFDNLYISNGFGSRGIINAASLTKELVSFMEEGIPLSSETNIQRYEKYWFN